VIKRWSFAAFLFALFVFSGISCSACSTLPRCLPIREFEYSPGCTGKSVVLEQRDCGQAMLIALVDQRMFFFSPDYGMTWRPSNRESLYPFGIADFGCSPYNQNVRYRIINENGLPFPVGPDYIEKSDNGGKTWIRKAGILTDTGTAVKPRGMIYFDPSDENSIYMGPILFHSDTANEAFCVSRDGGDTFSVVLSINGRNFAVSRSNPAVLYAADNECSIYKSEDMGRRWAVILSGPDFRKAALNSAVGRGIIDPMLGFKGGKCRAVSVDPKTLILSMWLRNMEYFEQRMGEYVGVD
jgi:hypothetical protein